MKRPLKTKILISVPATFIAVMLVVALVIWILLGKQNRQVAHTLLQNAFNMISYSISERQEKLLFNSHLMVSLDDMGANVNYVKQSTEYFGYNTLRPTYMKIVGTLYGVSTTANIWKANLYNSQGKLLAFVDIGENGNTLGCVHNRQTIELSFLKPNEELTHESWSKQDSLPLGIQYSLDPAMPDTEEIHFKVIDSSLCLVAHVPIMGKTYNIATEKMEAKQVGMVIAIQKIGTTFIKKMSELSGIEINIFTSEGPQCSGICCPTLGNYKTFDLSIFADAKNKWALTEQPVTLSDVNIGKHSYFQGAFPIYSNLKCIAAIVSLYSKEMARANTAKIIGLLSLVYFVGIILIVPITILLAMRGIVNPIKKVASMMRHIAQKKDFTKTVDVESQDEIGELAESFNDMTKNLHETTTSIDNLNKEIMERKKAEGELRESEERFKDVALSSADWIWEVDDKGGYTYCSEKVEDLLGYTKDEIIGKTPFDLMPKEEAKKIGEIFIQIAKNKEHIKDLENWNLTKSGKRICLLTNGVPILDEQDNLKGYRGVDKDITERKELMEDLSRSNQELEQFAYVASHDLQEPLRMVASYVKLLERRNKEKLDSDSKEFIDFAVDGATRMQGLINDLLMYSRVGTKGESFAPTECQAVYEKAIKNLEISIAEHKAKVTHDELPKVMADEGQLVQLFQNLIGNALKFCKDKTPEVHVSAKQERNNWIFGIRDNGIGIAPEHQERVFQIFQRLHSREEYKGTGIGLAVCKKIVERHGGKIWMESEVGKGTTFYFTMKGE